MGHNANELAVVTGAGRGLGFHLCEHLVRADYPVIAIYRSVHHRNALARLGTKCTPLIGDVRDTEFGDHIKSAVGGQPVQLLINNAGVVHPQHAIASLPFSDVEDSIQTHCLGPLRLVQALLPNMRLSTRPIVLNISSRWGRVTAPSQSTNDTPYYAYRIGKAALDAATVALAEDLGETFRCISVHPGTITTRLGPPEASQSPDYAAKQLLDYALADSPSREEIPRHVIVDLTKQASS